MKYKAWLLVFAPLILGLLAMLSMQGLMRPLPLVEFQIDMGSAVFFVGIFLSLLLLIWQVTRIRENHRYQQDLQTRRSQQQETHRRFLRRLDHQLKNPLTALRAALVNLSDEVNPRGEQALRDSNFQVERLSRLVGDLRKLAELDEQPLEKGEVSIPELLGELIQDVQTLPAHRGRHINLVVSRVPWTPPPVLGDPDLLGLAFYNLLENALKYSSVADVVEVRVLEDGRFLTVEVADSGPGIAADDLPHLFDELFRGDNAHGVEGSGLGLALARRIIQQHAGEISVRSRRQSQKGTVFTIRLPLGGVTRL
ncbi:MAG: sensor histidine kinase [Chloroflexi bacterium HGW-Chloroflexi-6]|nr:MAG: sensor histidine kinase [Chloroflexi bacterium HGW-Chloroflexi-6]